MKTLCNLTEWKDNEGERGRAAGRTIRSRYVIAADNWNWMIGIQRGGTDDAPVVGEKFFGNMSLLLAFLGRSAAEYGTDFATASSSIVSALQKRTGLIFTASLTPNSGKKIDDLYGTSQMREYPPKVLKAIFNDNSED